VLEQNGIIACFVPTATLTTLFTVRGISTFSAVSTKFEAITPVTTATNVLTLTGASTTITETSRSTYFSTLPHVMNHTTSGA
jgi:hypothetical protein